MAIRAECYQNEACVSRETFATLPVSRETLPPHLGIEPEFTVLDSGKRVEHQAAE